MSAFFKKYETAQKLRALRDHPATPTHEKRAAQLALDRLGPLPKPGQICYYCAMELGLKEGGIMAFTVPEWEPVECEACGRDDLPVSEDWV